MSAFSKGISPGVRVFRCLALFLLAAQAYLFLKDLSSWPRMLGIYLLIFMAGIQLGRSRLRFWIRLPLALLAPFVLRWIAFAVFRVVGALSPGLASDSLFPAFDETLLPLLPLWWWTAVSSDWAERSPTFTIVEAGMDPLFLAALFWSQRSSPATIYPHPSLPAAAAGLLFLSLAILAAHGVESKKRSSLPRLAGFFAILTALLLLVWGRYSEGASSQGGGLLRPTLFRFDFARYLKLETEISLSDDLVLIVRKDTEDSNLFLRGVVLSKYDKRGGFRPGPDGMEAPERLPKAHSEWPVPSWEGRHALEQEYWIVNLDPQAFLAIDAPVSVTPYRLNAGSSFSSAYQVVSSAPQINLPFFLREFDPARVPKEFELSSSERELYTAWGDDPRIAALAREAAAGAVTYYDRVNAVLSFLRENYYYSLKPGVAEDGDQLTQFLFEGKKGYCSYFAFSMTLLLRSLGMPARVAAGFFVDPDLAVLGFHPVRADMAHAWTEVWFGEYGWVAFDPTSQVPAPGEGLEESRGTDPAVLERLLREILRGDMASTSPKDEGGHGKRGERARAAASWLLRGIWFPLLVLYLVLIMAARGIRAYRVKRIRDGRRRALASWEALELALAAIGRRRSPGESIPDFGDRLDRENSELLGVGYGDCARLLESALYAPKPSQEAALSLEEGATTLRVRVSRSAGGFRRFLAFLDIRTAFRPLPKGVRG